MGYPFIGRWFWPVKTLFSFESKIVRLSQNNWSTAWLTLFLPRCYKIHDPYPLQADVSFAQSRDKERKKVCMTSALVHACGKTCPHIVAIRLLLCNQSFSSWECFTCVSAASAVWASHTQISWRQAVGTVLLSTHSAWVHKFPSAFQIWVQSKSGTKTYTFTHTHTRTLTHTYSDSMQQERQSSGFSWAPGSRSVGLLCLHAVATKGLTTKISSWMSRSKVITLMIMYFFCALNPYWVTKGRKLKVKKELFSIFFL